MAGALRGRLTTTRWLASSRAAEQRRRIQIVADKGTEKAHLLLHQRALVAVREHRVEIDHLGRLARHCCISSMALPSSSLIRAAMAATSASAARAEAVVEQRRDQRLTLDQTDLAAQRRQYEASRPSPAVASSTRSDTGLNAHCLGDHLPAAPTELTPMRRRTLYEVHPHRPRRLCLEQLQLQTGLAHLQRELGLGQLLRQTQALRPLASDCGE